MQIKTRQRVRDLAEVYTHTREVEAMLDLVPDMFPSVADPSKTDHKFFEPSAGSGNFLEEIFRRKLAFVSPERYRSSMLYEHRLLRALASIYAIDIDPENVDESRARVKHVIKSHLDDDLIIKEPTPGFASAVDAILKTNIVRANTLTELHTIEWVDYRAGRNGTFLREWSRVGETVQLDLFAQTRADEVPVHYSLLADSPDPVVSAKKVSA